MIRSLTLLLAFAIGGDSTRREEVVVDKVDIIEVNYVHDGDTGKLKYAQLLFWEWKRHLLLPQKDIYGKENGFWYRGSGYVIVDYRVYHNTHIKERLERYAIPRRSKQGWTSEFYDKVKNCQRRIHSTYFRTTHTEYDPEMDNKVLWQNALRKGLREPIADPPKKYQTVEEYMRELTETILNAE